MGRPKKNEEDKKGVVVRARLTNEDFEALKSVSEKFGMSMSQTIRVLIKESSNIAKNW